MTMENEKQMKPKTQNQHCKRWWATVLLHQNLTTKCLQTNRNGRQCLPEMAGGDAAEVQATTAAEEIGHAPNRRLHKPREQTCRRKRQSKWQKKNIFETEYGSMKTERKCEKHFGDGGGARGWRRRRSGVGERRGEEGRVWQKEMGEMRWERWN